MESSEIDEILRAAQRDVEAGAGLGPSGFWKAVAAVKRDRSLVDASVDRIAQLDRDAFEAWALFTVPAPVGTALMTAGTTMGLAAVWWAYLVDPPANGVLLLAGTLVTLVTTHGLAHLVVGRIAGMRFTHWFIGSVTRPQPGVKVDYATYLRAPARQRAWMHAAGAVVGKLIPFLALPPALVMDVPGWTVAVLLVLGVGQVVTDILWSTKASDWKKVRRELQYVD